MPTGTKSVEMNKIVTNSEMHLHHCLCESRGFNWKKQAPEAFNKTSVSEPDAGFFLSVLRNF